MAHDNGYELAAEARTALDQRFASKSRDETFGNARFARSLFEEAVTRQATRIVHESTDESSLRILTVDDVSQMGFTAVIRSSRTPSSASLGNSTSSSAWPM